jgi:hypothetical protein
MTATSTVRRRTAPIAAGIATAALLLAGCTSDNSASKAQSANNALAGNTYTKFNAAVPYPYAKGMPSDPLERKNLAKRLQQYNSKGSMNYVYVFAGMTDKVIGYYVIRGKVSSTSSQMTSTEVNVHCGYSGDHQSCTNDAIGDDGSYGPDEGGESGVFFFTVGGTLVETDQPFLVSSQPIKIYGDVPELDAPAVKH